MSGPARFMCERLFSITACTLVAMLLGCTGYWMLFTTFMPHDDEGYILWSMRQFCEGHPLYAEVFSQYGPVFYAWHRAWHDGLGLVFDSESARWLTLGYWLVATGACGFMGWRLTRSRFVAAVSGILSFAALEEMIREPFHPGGFLAAITAVGTAICLGASLRNAPRAFAITGVVAGTAMALTKINVGVFFLIALGSWVAIHSGGRKWNRAALALTGLGVVATPIALMKAHLGEGWARDFVLVVAASGLATLMNLRAQRRSDFARSHWIWMIVTAGMVIVSMVAFCAATGTSIGSIWEGVVTNPLRHPGLTAYEIEWRTGTVAGPILALALALTLQHFAPPWRSTCIAWLRLLGGLAVLTQLTGLSFAQPFHAVFQFAPALAWLMATPLAATGDSDPAVQGRSWLAWCAIWQTLQAYPVAGTQMAWGSFLFVPLLVAGSYDAIYFLAQRARNQHLAKSVGGGVLVGIAVIASGHLSSQALQTYFDREPLGLPGARSLRLPGALTSELRIMSRNAASHAGILFSAPGMFSFNIWSQKPTPTTANATVWGALLDDLQKRAIARRLHEDQTSMIVARLTDGKTYNSNNLLRPFDLALFVGNYSLWTAHRRTILPLGTVGFKQTADGRVFFVIVAAPTPRRIAGLQIREADWHVVAWKTAVHPDNAWRITPVNLQARPIAETRGETQSFVLPDYSLVQIAINTPLAGIQLDKIEVALTDADGAVIECFRFNKFASTSAFVPL